MKTRILLLAISAAFLSSCGTMYKSGQTPDDVYYSPGREQVGYVETKEDPEDNRRYTDEYTDERYLRMKSSNQRWSAFDDDYMYWNNPSWNNQLAFNSWGNPMMYGMNYGTGFGASNLHLGFGSFWGRSNYLSNPFCPIYYGQPVVIINPKGVYRNPVANGPRTYNLNAYKNTGTKRSSGVSIDPKTGATIYGNPPSSAGMMVNNGRTGTRVFSNMSTGTGSSSNINYSGSGNGSSRPRGGYSNSGNADSKSGSPTRTFEPSKNNNSSSSGNSAPSRSSGGSGSSGSSAPTRSFPRGGGN
jgi:hypothetical protein